MVNYAPRILGGPAQYNPPYSSVDGSYTKQQIVKVYDTSGNFLGVISDAPYLSSYKENINAAPDAVKMILPRRIDAFDGTGQPGSGNTIALGNNVQWWMYGAGLPSSGLLRYSGVIDTITPKLDENGGESVEVLVTPYGQIVGDHAVTTTLTFGTAGTSSTYIDTGAIFQSFFTGSYKDSTGATQSTIDAVTSNPYGNPFTMDPTSVAFTGQKTQFAFQNQTLLSALTNVLLLGPANYYFRLNPNKTIYFGKIPTSPTYTLYLGQNITLIEYSIDNNPRKNVIVIQGKGVQGKYTGSSVATIGQRVYFKSDNRITDATTAQSLANGIGALLDRQFVRAKIKVPDYRGDQLPGLGTDIEQFKVGQTLKIIDASAPASSAVGAGSLWGAFTWGTDKWGAPGGVSTIWGSFTWGNALWGASVGSIFNTVVTIMSIQYDYFSATLEVGWKAPVLNRKILDLEAKFQDATLVS